jgi:hypothetical protein
MKKNSTKKWLKGFALSALTLFAGVTTSYAQAPANDECTGAITLPVNTTGVCSQTAGTTIAATTSAQPMPCATNSFPDVWYTFTAANTQQTITVSDFSTSSFANVGVYSGTCAGLTSLSCTGTTGVVTATGLTVGTTYYLRVRTPAQNFNVCVGAPAAPAANDECAGAISVPVNSDTTCTQTVAGTMAGSTPSANPMSCGAAGPDVWFSFTATGTVHKISTPPFTAANSSMAVYSGSCAGLTQAYCGAPNAVVGGLTVGNTYYVRIKSTLANNSFNICITTLPSVTNDECAGAITAPVNAGATCTQSVAGSTVGSTSSTNALCVPTGTLVDVWYSFTASATDHTFNLTNTSGAMAVYSGNCGALTEIHCGSANTTVSGLTIGNTYYARILTNPPGATFNFCITTPPPPAPANDECAGAITLPVNTNGICTQTAGTTINATTSTQSMCNSTNVDPDVWYTFTALNTQQTITLSSFSSAAFATVVVYSGTCPAGLTSVFCTPTTGTATVTGLTAGNTYYLRVRTPAQNFNVCVGAPPPPLPGDECVDAISVPVNSDTTCTQSVAATMVGATPSTNAMTCFTPGIWSDVWFSFTAGSATQKISTPAFNNTNCIMTVYGGSCGALTQTYCGAPNSILTSFTPGNTYYVRISSGLANSAFNICINTPVLPTNDECAGAIPVPVNSSTACTQTLASTTINATPSTDASCLPSGVFGDVWHSFTATATDHIISLTNAAVNGSSAVIIYSGSCGALTQVYCGGADTVNNLIVGNTYYLRLATPAAGTFDICITTPTPPGLANDECAGAISVPVNADATCTQTLAGTTIGATTSAESMPCATNSNPDVWYTFTATNATENITVSSLTVNPFANIAVYSGNCSSLVQLACSVGPSTSVTGLTPGNTYYLRVRTQAQDFTVCISAPLPPITNDECAGAVSVPVNANATCTQTLAATMTGATASSDPLSCFTTGTLPDVWFTFTAGGSTHNISTPPFTVNDSRMAVYSGNCGGLTEVYCGPPNATVTGLTAGSTYYVRILSIAASTFNICVSTPAPLPVSMGQLTGNIADGKAILKWSTYSEQINKGFDVMRSEDGKTFRSVGWIPSQATNGNSSALLDYSFTDPKAIAGSAYYQLRQTDLDGKTALSNIVVLSTDGSNENTVMRAYPNPAKDILHIDIMGNARADGQVSITDLTGKTLIKRQWSSTTGDIDLKALPAGIYFVKYANSSASAIQKIVKK